MDYYLLLIQLFFAFMGLHLFWKGLRFFHQIWKYKKIKAMIFPEKYKNILQNIHQYKVLLSTHKEKIHLLILMFIDQKEFIWVKMTLDEEVKVIVAFYACLMRLGFDLGKNDHVRTIIIYPEHFIVNNSHTSGGIHYHATDVLEGQSSNGTVVISWQDIKHDISEQKKDNVIIHEFAHELDFEDGFADGTPILENMHYKTWSEIFSKSFDMLKGQMKKGKTSNSIELLGTYALTDEAEFFAVCSERFFETPRAFKLHFPDIYHELRNFYKLDTHALFNS